MCEERGTNINILEMSFILAFLFLLEKSLKEPGMIVRLHHLEVVSRILCDSRIIISHEKLRSNTL